MKRHRMPMLLGLSVICGVSLMMGVWLYHAKAQTAKPEREIDAPITPPSRTFSNVTVNDALTVKGMGNFKAKKQVESSVPFVGMDSEIPQLGGPTSPFVLIGLIEGSQIPALTIDQRGSGDSLRCAPPGGNPKAVIDYKGYLGIGVQPAYPIHHVSGAHLTEAGVWTDASDKNLKENFVPVDGKLILEGIERLPIFKYNYKAEGNHVQRIGPTAQDFYTTFRLGKDDKTISPKDLASLSLKAIQELKKEIDLLKVENEELRARLKALEEK
ncbi:tail fiber domain-containing protein [Candidatus Poribacteria bacterium]|nr:tail fiber domain-containing protein [Candidatus Poribacteria bacterium]